MTLDEAIRHAEEVAANEPCEECADEHVQLAAWLTELKVRRQAEEKMRKAGKQHGRT